MSFIVILKIFEKNVQISERNLEIFQQNLKIAEQTFFRTKLEEKKMNPSKNANDDDDVSPALKKPKMENSSPGVFSNDSPATKISKESGVSIFDPSKVAQLIKKIADRLDNNNNNQKIDTTTAANDFSKKVGEIAGGDGDDFQSNNNNLFDNMSKIKTKSEKFPIEEINEAKNRSIDNLDFDQTKRYVSILRHLLQIKDVELRMAELKNLESKKEIDNVNNKLNVITKKMENFK
uniref:Uncharacterized protein n=1 Tax=Romanomermis culicivorax TaxID=13658 RepID=A0A915JDW2_ROMCU